MLTRRASCSVILGSTKSRRSAFIRQRAGLVSPQEAAVTDHVRRESRYVPTLDPRCAQRALPRMIGSLAGRSPDCLQRVCASGGTYSTELSLRPGAFPIESQLSTQPRRPRPACERQVWWKADIQASVVKGITIRPGPVSADKPDRLFRSSELTLILICARRRLCRRNTNSGDGI
jgi:hypothetical protein